MLPNHLQHKLPYLFIVTEDFLASTKGVSLVQRLYHDIFDDQDAAQSYGENLKLYEFKYLTSIVT